ncbi:hypothetical protein ACIPLC_24405 [Kitasatospora sp. NPDC086801]
MPHAIVSWTDTVFAIAACVMAIAAVLSMFLKEWLARATTDR